MTCPLCFVGSPEQHPSLKPTTEMEDPVVREAVQRKNVQASRADSGSSDESAVSVFHKLCVDSCPKPDDEDLTVTTKVKWSLVKFPHSVSFRIVFTFLKFSSALPIIVL
ncbi:ankyrin repeat domain-containing protein 20A2-like [Sapajus apella]|uniref:Ankyrin repeat domain-containing protein 20A2-like n=1 Tax=Sapajus apella TaxID=9515 RepID=A0A6J3FRQ1_SAPAP|nr:ankyrin repeat domain-containing protein 20A2-like [Sapajus apella]